MASVPRVSVAEQKEACQGIIASIEIRGCNIRQCEVPDFENLLLRIAGLEQGATIDEQVVGAAKSRLLETGLFSDISITCKENRDGLTVTVTLRPLPRIRTIKINGSRHFYEATLLERLPLERGDPLDPSDPHTAEVLENVREAIKKAYADEGFYGTDVDLLLEPAGEGLLNLYITVREGERLRVSAVDVVLRPRKAAEQTKGKWDCPVVRASDLKKWTGVSPGDPLTQQTQFRAAQNLSKALRRIGFSGVQTEIDFEKENGRLNVQATYGSCYLIRLFIREKESLGRQGFRPLDDKDVMAVLPFGDSGVFDLEEAELGRESLRQYFEERGFLFADVVLDFRSFRGRSRRPSWVGANVDGIITYLITTNRKREIRRILFPGRKALDESRLREVMTTKTYDFFGNPGAVLPDQVFQDIERLRELYRREGFLSVRFLWGAEGVRRRESSREGKETVYTYIDGNRAFRVRTRANTSAVVLEIGIDEGPRSILGKVRFEGVTALNVARLAEELDLKEGKPFSPLRVQEAVRELSRRYANAGFLRARVEVRCKGFEPVVDEAECDVMNVNSREVELSIHVEEGRQSRVLGVIVDGLQRTQESTVRREFPKPGAPYSQREIAQAVRTLKNYGIFRSVQVKGLGMAEVPPRDEVALLVRCSEARTRFLDIAGGFETLNRAGDFPGYITSPLSTTLMVQDRATTSFGRVVGLQIPDVLVTAEVRYSDTNFLGKAKRLYLPVKYGISATAWDRYGAFTPTYVDTRFLTRGLHLRLTPFVIYDRATTRLDIFQFGLETALTKEVLPRFYLGLGYEVSEVKSRDPETEVQYSPFRLENKVIPTLTFDRLDHPLNPKKGGIVQANLAYINTVMGKSAGNFLKFEGTAKGYFTIRNFLTFCFMLRYGTSKSFQKSGKLPQEERFTLGGNRGVRGFGNDAIAQYNPDGSLRLERMPDGTLRKPYGGDIVLSGSAEIRFPIVSRISLNAAVFYDFGALADRVRDLSVASFRHSAGFGIRYLIAGTVPLRLDYGVILDRRCRDVDPRTGLCTQMEELGNIHFGFLYAF